MELQIWMTDLAVKEMIISLLSRTLIQVHLCSSIQLTFQQFTDYEQSRFNGFKEPSLPALFV